MRALVLLISLTACGGAQLAPLVFRVTNHGPRAVIELSGSVGDAGITGTQLLSDGESLTAKQGDVEVGTSVKLSVRFNQTSCNAEPRTVPAEGLLIAAERSDAGCVFTYGTPAP